MTTKLGSYILVPAQYIGRKYKKELNQHRQNLCKRYNTNEIDIIAKDNIHLNAMLFQKPKSFFSFLKSKKIIIPFGGNGENYEFQDYENNYIDKAHKLDYDVLLFNYRGVGKSKGSPSPEGLTKDGEAVIDHAISQGYDPKNILIHAHSLGGAVATKALAANLNKYQKIKFINDRSFSSLKSVILNFSIFSIFKYFMLLMLYICKWNIDVTKEWEKLKNKRISIISLNDEIIPFKGSLSYESEKISKHPKIFFLENFSHNTSFTFEEMKSLISKV